MGQLWRLPALLISHRTVSSALPLRTLSAGPRIVREK
jgi:hypothetical protein